ncbi:MAG: MCE family protein [Bacteroidetes bacterium]|nr:MAG: MCE family protein [Bacteroidota bacterium]
MVKYVNFVINLFGLRYKREIGIGLVFIVALALFIWGFSFLKGFNLFKEQRVLYAVYERVSGLSKANPVSINGLKVGQVTDIYFDPEFSGNIIVEITIETALPIPKNSVALIYSSDLMGSKAIDLKLGTDSILTVNNDTLLTRVEASLKEAVNQQIQPLKAKAEELIVSIDSVVTVIKQIFNEQARENLTSSLASVQATFENLENASYNLDQMIAAEKIRFGEIMANLESITTTISENEENIDNILANFSVLSDSLAKAEIPQTFANINRVVGDVADIVEKIDNGEGSIGMLVNDDDLYNDLQTSAEQLHLLLEDLRVNPKRYVRFSLF